MFEEAVPPLEQLATLVEGAAQEAVGASALVILVLQNHELFG